MPKGKKNRPQIALIICTRNNYEKLNVTLLHVAHHITEEIELIVVDQSPHPQPILLEGIPRVSVVFDTHNTGLSKARNKAIRYTQADIIAWTDDDCIITKAYIRELLALSKLAKEAKQKKIAGVCGKTLPYFITRPTSKHTCPCTFSKEKGEIVPTSLNHYKYIGLGNNMVFFRHVFEELGGFKEWLGVGSIGESGEDGEFMIRCVLAQKSFLYNPKMLIYHNKWLNSEELIRQNRKYLCGGLAFYGYYSLRGVQEVKETLFSELRYQWFALKQDLKFGVRNSATFSTYFRKILLDAYFFSKGISLAIWHGWLR